MAASVMSELNKVRKGSLRKNMESFIYIKLIKKKFKKVPATQIVYVVYDKYCKNKYKY